MNTNLFNSFNELSSRIILTLYSLDEHPKSSNFISCLDYMTIYSKSLGVGSINLHGDNPYKFSEFPSRLTEGDSILKRLVLHGLCDVEINENTLLYKINDAGFCIASSFTTQFSIDYLNISIDLVHKFLDTTDTDILAIITKNIKQLR